MPDRERRFSRLAALLRRPSSSSSSSRLDPPARVDLAMKDTERPPRQNQPADIPTGRQEQPDRQKQPIPDTPDRPDIPERQEQPDTQEDTDRQEEKGPRARRTRPASSTPPLFSPSTTTSTTNTATTNTATTTTTTTAADTNSTKNDLRKRLDRRQSVRASVLRQLPLNPAHVPADGRPSIAVRRQSLVPPSQQRLISSLLDHGAPDMPARKVWVRRPGSSPTLVPVAEDDLVDDLRDAILRKYANSLGRTVDPPDIAIRLVQREPVRGVERVLGPEEPLVRTLDHFYPGGQTVDEALVIEVAQQQPQPQRRTPKPSPLTPYTHGEDREPGEYFPPMHMIAPSAALKETVKPVHPPPPPSMAVLTTGQLPPVPSPGSRGSWATQPHRGSYGLSSQGAPASLPSPSTNNESAASPPSTTPPALTAALTDPPKAASPPSRVSSPRPTQAIRKLNNKGSSGDAPSILPASILDGAIPPINVLIVEDNTINLKLLEAFMKRLKVRWQTAMNGREAVTKWREGGFHLVLMDIQLPVMNGLDATREIRRLERVNNIGVFQRTGSGPSYSATMVGSPASSVSAMSQPETKESAVPVEEGELRPEDVLDKESLFKSPVIIVALTASSLQSDRHEALAAGCNDFLTKPVNIVWLEQKVTEWGCMQALIDFEGWRRWRGFTDDLSTTTTSTKENADKTPRKASSKASLGKASSGNVRKGRAASTAYAGSDGSTDDSSSTNDSSSTVLSPQLSANNGLRKYPAATKTARNGVPTSPSHSVSP